MSRQLNKKIWPYSITLKPYAEDPFISPDPRKNWLGTNLGRDQWYVIDHRVKNPTFYFKQEQDMTWFLLYFS